jgi:hypothetical protein
VREREREREKERERETEREREREIERERERERETDRPGITYITTGLLQHCYALQAKVSCPWLNKSINVLCKYTSTLIMDGALHDRFSC